MKALRIESNVMTEKQTKPKAKPVTSRGRALFTVDWFLNGRTILYDYDNPDLVIRDLSRLAN